jgi:hypothetical protein
MRDYDDAELICNILQREWSLKHDRPEISFEPERLMMSARTGAVFVSNSSQSTSISSVDYATLDKIGYVSIRLSSRFREDHFRWRNEIWRILMDNRRPGRISGKLGDYTHLEVTKTHRMTDLSGWYVTVFEVRLIGYCVPIDSSGFSMV